MPDGMDRDTSQWQSTGTSERMKEQVSGTIDQAKEKAANLGRRAVDRVEAQREPAAGALDKTASRLHERGDQFANTAAGAAHATADKIQSIAEYVRHHDTKAMMDDVGDMVRRYPGPFLAAAAAVGFLAGRAFRNYD